VDGERALEARHVLACGAHDIGGDPIELLGLAAAALSADGGSLDEEKGDQAEHEADGGGHS